MSDRIFPVQNSTLSTDALAERVLKRYHLSGQAVCRFFRKGICDTYRIEAGGAEYYLKVYVARMHQCADNMCGPYRRNHLDMSHLVDENLATIAPLMAHRGAEFDLIKDIAEHCGRRISQSLPKSKPEYGICHGDLHGGDVRYGENNVPVLFDFDSSGCGWRALDIGVFLASDEWMDTTIEAESRRQSRLAAFLEGYSTIRRLSESELSVIQLGPPVRHIYLMGFVLRYTTVQEGEHWANDHFIDWHMLWFEHWAQNHLAKEI